MRWTEVFISKDGAIWQRIFAILGALRSGFWGVHVRYLIPVASRSRADLRKSIDEVEEGQGEAIGPFPSDVLWPPREYIDDVPQPRMLAEWLSDVAVPREWLEPSVRPHTRHRRSMADL